MNAAPFQHLTQPKRLLIIKPSAVGDVVQSLAVLARVARHWPGTEVSWLVTPACQDLVRGHPMVRQTILFDRKGLSRWFYIPVAAGRFKSLIQELRAPKFDMAMDLQGLSRSAWLARLSGAPVRIGLKSAREGAGLLYTHSVDDQSAGYRNATLRYLEVATALGLGRADEPVDFPLHVSAENAAAVEAHLSPLVGRPFTLLCPTTNWPTKQWPMAHVAALSRDLMASGKTVVLSAAPNEAAGVAAVTCHLSLAGKITLGQLVEVIRRAEHVVTADSGPMHIAAAARRPLTALFGPTDPGRTGPFNMPQAVLRLPIVCSPCLSRTCSHQSCLQGITPSQVLQHITLSGEPR